MSSLCLLWVLALFFKRPALALPCLEAQHAKRYTGVFIHFFDVRVTVNEPSILFHFQKKICTHFLAFRTFSRLEAIWPAAQRQHQQLLEFANLLPLGGRCHVLSFYFFPPSPFSNRDNSSPEMRNAPTQGDLFDFGRETEKYASTSSKSRACMCVCACACVCLQGVFFLMFIRMIFLSHFIFCCGICLAFLT